ncbi:FAD-binding oxidoreductase [Aquamicrobium sp. LC103]|uniref:NAD(P)/FAD-dependent oxidoreductase n=1 Tax=Aquamicrobium sp. LC103 TaxID=1120658 RepID=UPI00063EC14B|nr:FAD-binding oxidoreductase [Aquamicrobium sp. LC103]TKT75845.1 FAD-binding oxidoreductase [Aquamicrobium sp. LC103]
MRDITTSDFKFQPYWWDAAAPMPFTAGGMKAAYDVVVVGSGFTGISAALHLARAGRSVAVLDRQDPGAGASRRNAGFVGRVLKKSYSELVASKGRDKALTIYRELHDAYAFTFDLIAREGIDCYAVRPGRFIGATSRGHYNALAKDLAILQADMGFEHRMLAPTATAQGLETDIYSGGAIVPDSGSLHPGLYHKGLLDRAVEAGVSVFGRTEVENLQELSDGRCEVRTDRGTVYAGKVVVATNGYVSKLGWFRRRVVPFRAYMAATEEMPQELLDRLIPHGRTIIDSNTNIDFFRPAPDSRRILFGGATAAPLKGPEEITVRMKSIIDRVLPQACNLKLSHAWDGYCAGTFDLMPHVGRRGNVYYAMGYNFAGVTMGTRFGARIANSIATGAGLDSVFEARNFPTMPFYTGTPWFLGLVMRYFDWHDRRLARRG